MPVLRLHVLAFLMLFGSLVLARCAPDLEGEAEPDLPAELALPKPIERDLDAIQQRDTLVLLTAFNSTSYFLYRGEPMGYEYELLQAYARDHDLVLKTIVVHEPDSLYIRLNQGEGDLVAARIVPTERYADDIAFTRAIYFTEPVLVQREPTADEPELPEDVDTLVAEIAEGAESDPEMPEELEALEEKAEEVKEVVEDAGEVAREAAQIMAQPLPEQLEFRVRMIRRPSDLAGEEVYLIKNSAYVEQLMELSDSISGDIFVVEVDSVTMAESLIQGVALEQINFTVTQENLADLNEEYYSNIAVRPTMGTSHQVTWAARVNAPFLVADVNEWLAEPETQRLTRVLYQKYFIDRQGYRERVTDEYLTSTTGKLSAYDDLFRTFADSIGWDWRLLASQAFQESRFNPTARSWAGATGLLQLMPPTAREFGVRDMNDPHQNVAGAIRFIHWLENYWADKILDPTERLKFVLASYNTGHGHVEDARRLAAKNGDDPHVWGEVAYWLLQKSKREYYSDPVVKYGFCRGLEPVTYVSRILDRYDHYRQFVVT